MWGGLEEGSEGRFSEEFEGGDQERVDAKQLETDAQITILKEQNEQMLRRMRELEEQIKSGQDREKKQEKKIRKLDERIKKQGDFINGNVEFIEEQQKRIDDDTQKIHDLMTKVILLSEDNTNCYNEGLAHIRGTCALNLLPGE